MLTHIRKISYSHLSKWTLLQPSGGIASRAKGTVNVAWRSHLHFLKMTWQIILTFSLAMMASQVEAEVTQAPGNSHHYHYYHYHCHHYRHLVSVCTDGGAIGRYQDWLWEVKERVKDCLVVDTDQIMKLP